jgi:hypothetical protein
MNFERLFLQLSANPAKVKFRRLTKLMELAGFRAVFGSGDMAIFTHPDSSVLPMARKPSRFGYVEQAYVQQCLNAAQDMKLREERTDG